jgi:putative flippase GtrA
MTLMARFTRFNVVGALGVAVQLACVAALVHGGGVDPVTATAAGVVAAVVHNFAWHIRWTWRDRAIARTAVADIFTRFVAANGAVSLIGSVALMPFLAGILALPAIPANLVTIAICGLVNFRLGDRIFGEALKP